MEHKPKRKGLPQRPYIVSVVIASMVLLVLILSLASFYLVFDADRVHIVPLDVADVPTAQYLKLNPEINTQSQMGNTISTSMMAIGDDHYLCLDVLPLVFVEINQATLSIHVNGESVPYAVNTDNVPMGCILLQASFERGWYIFDMEILDGATGQPAMSYRWGVEVR